MRPGENGGEKVAPPRRNRIVGGGRRSIVRRVRFELEESKKKPERSERGRSMECRPHLLPNPIDGDENVVRVNISMSQIQHTDSQFEALEISFEF